MVESVSLLNPILKEETVTQSVIAYGVLHLGRRKKTTRYRKKEIRIFRALRVLDRRENKYSTVTHLWQSFPFQGRGSLHLYANMQKILVNKRAKTTFVSPSWNHQQPTGK